ncbi:MAG TPA: acetyl-CoA hydrolase/transferase C-terminal domain-containing protein [Methylomirabilota bacterium]|jgi:acyl-CoA hydrolase|nr:acetyl-CoA hydrolase/transferase C-terminal domain-containing protein [Methylomirabilota bacterium]
MNWRERCGNKLVSAQEAMKAVRNGDTVQVNWLHATPVTLCDALMARKEELHEVKICTIGPLYNWDQPGAEKAFTIQTPYLGATTRPLMEKGRVDFIPVMYYRHGELPPGLECDVYLTPVSPPDKHGYCSFGVGLFMSKTMAAHARVVIAEVHEDFVRTGGENFIHVSEVSHFVEPTAPPAALPATARNDEEVAATEIICTLVANELIRDGDTVQIGLGSVSSPLAMYLENKNDLGIHTEVIPGGVARLVQKGVVTGKYKTVNPGKVVASGGIGVFPDELAIIDGNPNFEFYDFTYTDDLRLLVNQKNYVAVNNALAVDLSGQACSESIGPYMYTGAGGQTIFTIAAAYGNPGKAVIVTPSSAVVKGRRLSRIVPMLEPGSVVTAQRAFVDYVVTEQGIAQLRGKSLKQRAAALIEVAHPDFREELRKEAKRIYHL